ncbi:protein tramtrack, beta isoform-like [Pollicipes pollicipes]|uniref:protein tramtrack, beta isoform-like n=1 Tax=Pollicipes pollicipes TaxID=41117 RepID=UPI00188589BF|nr:protein tramtrack, beta isoform-like [Pollicipes pollicipes]
MDGQTFCLKWDGFQGSVTSLFNSLRQQGELVDITLCCEGQRLRAHRMMLSACSPYFRELLKDLPCQQMVIFLKDTSAVDLRAIIEFMYKGSVNVSQSQLASFIKTAEMLQIRGLSGDEEKSAPPVHHVAPPARQAPWSPPPGLRSETPTTAPYKGLIAYQDLMPHQHLMPCQDVVPHQDLVPYQDLMLCQGVIPHQDLMPYQDLMLYQNLMPYQDLVPYQGVIPYEDLLLYEDLMLYQDLVPTRTQARGGAIYSCVICGQSYTNPDSRQMHMKKHSGETTCPLCGKIYSMVHNLRRHMRNAHDVDVRGHPRTVFDAPP